jgi:apolipoprotein N-acyltransferase
VYWTRSGALPFDAALLQGSVAQEEKFADLDASLDYYTETTREVAGEAEIVVWPETAVPTFYNRVATRLNGFAREMAERDTHVVTGVFTLSDTDDRYFNAVRQLGAGHRDYRKQRLVPFGEYLPLRDWLAVFERYIQVPMSDISPGRPDQPPLEVGRYRIGASVCYEAAYPGVMRALAPAAGVLVNVSNDGWFGDSTAPFQHLQMARVRSRELARPMLRATNTGITAIIDHRGRILAQGAQFEPTVVEARVEPRAGATPYTRWGNVPALAIAVIILASPGAVRWYRRRGA